MLRTLFPLSTQLPQMAGKEGNIKVDGFKEEPKVE